MSTALVRLWDWPQMFSKNCRGDGKTLVFGSECHWDRYLPVFAYCGGCPNCANYRPIPGLIGPDPRFAKLHTSQTWARQR